jgi:hypothetical protein
MVTGCLDERVNMLGFMAGGNTQEVAGQILACGNSMFA